MADNINSHEGRNTGLHSSSGEEHEEHSGAVKEDKENQNHETHHRVTLLQNELVDDDQEHVVAVDAEKAYRDGGQVVDVVHAEELSVGIVADEKENNFDTENDELDEEQEDRGEEDKVERPNRHLWSGTWHHTHKWRGS